MSGFNHLLHFEGSSCCGMYQNFIPFYNWINYTVWMNHIFKCHSYVNEHLSCFCLFPISNNAAMNIAAHRCVWVPAFNSLGVYLGVEWLNPVAFLCCLWGAAELVFILLNSFSHCIILYSHQQWAIVPISPQPHQYLFPLYPW